MSNALTVPYVPRNVESWIARKEAAIIDIRTGCEKKIIWHKPAEKRKTDIAVVYLHGFSASRKEVDPLPQLVAGALGANLFYSRLSGHGQSDDALGEATVLDWQQDVLEAAQIAKRLGRRTMYIGTSTGATLASWFSCSPFSSSSDIFIFMSPNYRPKSPFAFLLGWPIAPVLARLILGKYRSWTPKNEEQAKYWTHRYPSKATIPMMKLVNATRRQNQEEMKKPVLFILSKYDRTVSAAESFKIYHRIGSKKKQLHLVPPLPYSDSHVLAGDILAPENTEAMSELILQYLSDVAGLSLKNANENGELSQ